MPPLDLTITCDVGEEHADFIARHLAAAAALLDERPDALSVPVVDDETMAELHERFLQIEGPTDVLTFEMARDGAGRVTEGEVLVCLGEAERQIEGRRHGVREELLLYALHGLLHLSGHDDLTDADHARMHAKEDELLEAIGIGALFGNATP